MKLLWQKESQILTNNCLQNRRMTIAIILILKMQHATIWKKWKCIFLLIPGKKCIVTVKFPTTSFYEASMTKRITKIDQKLLDIQEDDRCQNSYSKMKHATMWKAWQFLSTVYRYEMHSNQAISNDIFVWSFYDKKNHKNWPTIACKTGGWPLPAFLF